ncbi:MAG: hypothetical protein DBY09_01575 [Selenomonadales bacterium]|jgi:hypothetical protein|nr:MAG: hypothetical protein DBY09_01575 [Selenomonadales bacterium]
MRAIKKLLLRAAANLSIMIKTKAVKPDGFLRALNRESAVLLGGGYRAEDFPMRRQSRGKR